MPRRVENFIDRRSVTPPWKAAIHQPATDASTDDGHCEISKLFDAVLPLLTAEDRLRLHQSLTAAAHVTEPRKSEHSIHIAEGELEVSSSKGSDRHLRSIRMSSHRTSIGLITGFLMGALALTLGELFQTNKASVDP